MIKSGFKSKADYNGAFTVNEILQSMHFETMLLLILMGGFIHDFMIDYEPSKLLDS
jgi:hypothetical protein